MLSKARRFSAKLNFENYEDLYRYLEGHNAFYEADEGRNLKVD
jgi:hypothetical protein